MQLAGTLCNPAKPPCSLQGHFATLQTLLAHRNEHFARLQCLKTITNKGVSPMKINQIGLNRLRNDANFQFHTEFKELAEKLNPEALKIKHQFEAYLPLYDKVGLALKKIAKSSITEQTSATYNILQELKGKYAPEVWRWQKTNKRRFS
jgi:hypothetical protein